MDSMSHPEQGPDGRPFSRTSRRSDWIMPTRPLSLYQDPRSRRFFAGSGAQIDLLRRGEIVRLPKDVRNSDDSWDQSIRFRMASTRHE